MREANSGRDDLRALTLFGKLFVVEAAIKLRSFTCISKIIKNKFWLSYPT